jgi:hypothetical protein
MTTRLIKFWFECYQQYESPVKGFLLSSNDFLMLNKDGIMMINLGNGENKEVYDNENFKRMMKPLGSCNYLRLEKSNHI